MDVGDRDGEEAKAEGEKHNVEHRTDSLIGLRARGEFAPVA
jgi:hypothetical protein